MSNKILRALTIERIEHLKLAFSTSREVFWEDEKTRILHPGEYGVYREKAVSELLQLFIPESLGIGTGFIITNQGDVSSQCDIIVYDRSSTPNIVTNSHQRFFPVESVLAVGEVKSDISSISQLVSYLVKLSLIKGLLLLLRNCITSHPDVNGEVKLR